jgi:hypothetical protein
MDTQVHPYAKEPGIILEAGIIQRKMMWSIDDPTT